VNLHVELQLPMRQVHSVPHLAMALDSPVEGQEATHCLQKPVLGLPQALLEILSSCKEGILLTAREGRLHFVWWDQ